MTKYMIALCLLKARDQRLLEMLLALPSASQFQFSASDASFSSAPSVAIVDSASPPSLAAFADLRQRHPQVVPVVIVDREGVREGSRFVVHRSSLLRTIFKVLTDAVADRAGKPDGVPAPDADLAAAHAAAQNASEVAFVDGSAGIPDPLRALIVDDSSAVREQLRAALDRLGFTCDQAASAAEAQTLLAGRKYDLSLLDVVMPGMDGYELCRKIKQDPSKRDMPVVMLTSRSSPFDRARGMLAGCDSYLTKPITWDDFRTALDRALLKSARNDRSKLTARGYTAGAQRA
ncbi:MAG TPA: response regulator [Burkholderiales bacterium]|nr:response regulator [Burkholderiales bacterium]